MDAHALLSSQGWRGNGHSLHKTDDSIGLANPLLLNRKDNTKGLGTTQHFTSDQWWMNAFDEQLQGLDTSKKGQVVQTITSGKLNVMEKGSLGKWALYASFVSGGLLKGTISNKDDDDTSTSESDDESDLKKPGQVKLEGLEKKENKEERRARKEAKRRRKDQRAAEKAARRERKSKYSKSRKSKSRSTSDEDADEEKQRRRAKKEEKRRRRKQEEGCSS